MLGDDKVALLGGQLRSDSVAKDAPAVKTKRKRTRGVNMIKNAQNIVSVVFADKFLMPQSDWMTKFGIDEEKQMVTKRMKEKAWENEGQFHYSLRILPEDEFESKKVELENAFRLVMVGKEEHVSHLVTIEKITLVWQTVCDVYGVKSFAKTGKANANMVEKLDAYDRATREEITEDRRRSSEVEILNNNVRKRFTKLKVVYDNMEKMPFDFAPSEINEKALELFNLCDKLGKEVEVSLKVDVRKVLTILVEQINFEKNQLAKNHIDQDWASEFFSANRTLNISITSVSHASGNTRVEGEDTAMTDSQDGSERTNSTSSIEKEQKQHDGSAKNYEQARRVAGGCEKQMFENVRKISGNKAIMAKIIKDIHSTPPLTSPVPLSNAASNQNIIASGIEEPTIDYEQVAFCMTYRINARTGNAEHFNCHTSNISKEVGDEIALSITDRLFNLNIRDAEKQ